MENKIVPSLERVRNTDLTTQLLWKDYVVTIKHGTNKKTFSTVLIISVVLYFFFLYYVLLLQVGLVTLRKFLEFIYCKVPCNDRSIPFSIYYYKYR